MANRLVWMIVPEHFDEFLDAAEEYTDWTSVEFNVFLAQCHEKNWVIIFGQTDKEPEDIAACLEEFNIKVDIHKDSGEDNGN